MPVSSQTLFRRSGVPVDLLEIELRAEGYLFKNENLIEVLKHQENLKRQAFGSDGENEGFAGLGDFPENWTDEDYQYFFNRRIDVRF